MTNGKNSTCDFLREGTLFSLFWGEQQAIAALVAVACIFSARHLNDGGRCSWPGNSSPRKAVKFLGNLASFGGIWPVDGTCLAFYFLTMIVFSLKVLLAIGAGLVMTALL